MSPLEPIDPIVESPLSHPMLKQRAIASELLTEVQQANNAIGGMLLVNMERNGMIFLRELFNFGCVICVGKSLIVFYIILQPIFHLLPTI